MEVNFHGMCTHKSIKENTEFYENDKNGTRQ